MCTQVILGQCLHNCIKYLPIVKTQVSGATTCNFYDLVQLVRHMFVVPWAHFYPHTLLKKLRGYCYRVRPCVHLSVRLLCHLLLNHWTKFNQIWCVSYSHEWGAQRQIFWPRPLGRGQKVKYHLISITKSISKIFIPNFVCVLTNERYKTYQTGFLFYRLGHALGVGLGGA